MEGEVDVGHDVYTINQSTNQTVINQVLGMGLSCESGGFEGLCDGWMDG
jgi:hypothetical protein